ncbi:MAG TPA: DUF3048 domain-containing protein [Actinomycetota bacterium]|nr:DUF3048 domain-containing protein [Actinomycetota bacterium]
MTTGKKRALAIGAGILVVAGGAFFLLRNNVEDIPVLGHVLSKPKCPLTGVEPKDEKILKRPALGVKIENNPSAYPLSGLQYADVVYEEQVEGGLTRFMAIFHCSDATIAGPVRSSREVDPAILAPYTRILAAAGGNPGVRANLEKFDVVLLDENTSGDAMERRARTGYSSEHTLYGNTKALRALGRKKYKTPPSDDIFTFGDLEGTGKKTSTVSLDFGNSSISFSYKRGRWYRSDGDSPLTMENGPQLSFDNVLIERHTVNLSTKFADVLGTPSPYIEDVTGTGEAVLFRDGRMLKGKWVRESTDDPVHFETKGGDDLVLKPGRTMIELLPDDKGEVTGSFVRSK